MRGCFKPCKRKKKTRRPGGRGCKPAKIFKAVGPLARGLRFMA